LTTTKYRTRYIYVSKTCFLVPNLGFAVFWSNKVQRIGRHRKIKNYPKDLELNTLAKYIYSMLPSFRTGPVFVQKHLYLIIFVGRSNLRQPKNSENKRNISAVNCRFCRAFWRRSRSTRTISFEVSKSLAANICTFHCTVKVL